MRTTVFAAVYLTSTAAFAQQGEIAPAELGKKALDGKAAAPAEPAATPSGSLPSGRAAAGDPPAPWTFALNLGLSGSFADSRDVVGQLNGSTKNVGLVLDGSGVWKSGQHEVENLLKVQHSQTSAPPTDVFVKSTDQLDLATTYLYYLQAVSWLGPYARAKLSTNLMTSHLVFAEDVDVSRNEAAATREPSGRRIRTNGPFEPLTLFQSAGLFAKPLTAKRLVLETKVGVGAQEIIVRDGLFAPGEPATIEGEERKRLVLTDLEDSEAAGAEFELAAAGALTETLSYGIKANFFQPFAGAEEGKDGLQTTIEGKASIKVAKWASVDYVLTAKKIPAIQGNDANFQVSNAFMVTAGFNLM